MLKNLLFIGAGDALGSVLRYFITYYCKNLWQSILPFGTFCVNILGCLLVGLFLGFTLKLPQFDQSIRFLLMIGFCGGFTTFSTFALENFELVENGKWAIALLYTVGSLVLGILCVAFGVYISKMM